MGGGSTCQACFIMRTVLFNMHVSPGGGGAVLLVTHVSSWGTVLFNMHVSPWGRFYLTCMFHHGGRFYLSGMFHHEDGSI